MDKRISSSAGIIFAATVGSLSTKHVDHQHISGCSKIVYFVIVFSVKMDNNSSIFCRNDFSFQIMKMKKQESHDGLPRLVETLSWWWLWKRNGENDIFYSVDSTMVDKETQEYEMYWESICSQSITQDNNNNKGADYQTKNKSRSRKNHLVLLHQTWKRVCNHFQGTTY